jgi:hypothetical protein
VQEFAFAVDALDFERAASEPRPLACADLPQSGTLQQMGVQ